MVANVIYEKKRKKKKDMKKKKEKNRKKRKKLSRKVFNRLQKVMPQVCSMERDILTYTGYVVVRGGWGTVFPASKCVLSSSRYHRSTNHQYLSVSSLIGQHRAVMFR